MVEEIQCFTYPLDAFKSLKNHDKLWHAIADESGAILHY